MHTSQSDPSLHENIISFARKVSSDEISTNLFEVKIDRTGSDSYRSEKILLLPTRADTSVKKVTLTMSSRGMIAATILSLLL